MSTIGPVVILRWQPGQRSSATKPNAGRTVPGSLLVRGPGGDMLIYGVRPGSDAAKVLGTPEYAGGNTVGLVTENGQVVSVTSVPGIVQGPPPGISLDYGWGYRDGYEAGRHDRDHGRGDGYDCSGGCKHHCGE